MTRFDIGIKYTESTGTHVLGTVSGVQGSFAEYPNNAEVRALLPNNYRKAFDRTQKWWRDAYVIDAPHMCALYTLRGRCIGTIFAKVV